MTATKDLFFKPSKVSADMKAKQTNSVVRQILDSEVADREKKTQGLRALRLAQLATDSSKKADPKK